MQCGHSGRGKPDESRYPVPVETHRASWRNARVHLARMGRRGGRGTKHSNMQCTVYDTSRRGRLAKDLWRDGWERKTSDQMTGRSESSDHPAVRRSRINLSVAGNGPTKSAVIQSGISYKRHCSFKCPGKETRKGHQKR